MFADFDEHRLWRRASDENARGAFWEFLGLFVEAWLSGLSAESLRPMLDATDLSLLADLVRGAVYSDDDFRLRVIAGLSGL